MELYVIRAEPRGIVLSAGDITVDSSMAKKKILLYGRMTDPAVH